MISISITYGKQAGTGGLGLQAATAIAGLSTAAPVVALGPGPAPDLPLEASAPFAVDWVKSPPARRPSLASRFLRRIRPGRLVFQHDCGVGRWAASELGRVQPGVVYVFTQVGLESLRWARSRGLPCILDNPNGHIRGFAEAYRREWAIWVGGSYQGHPTPAMIDRVEEEYVLADLIRVSSAFAGESLIRNGVPAGKVFACPQPVNLTRFVPPAQRLPPTGPLRVCYVGSLDLRKGFVYLLRAGRIAGPARFQFEFVGATGDRGSKALLAREGIGLDLVVKPGDPIPAYHRAELFVLPSLEDGFGFVAAEAMACGVPVVVTDQCGAAEWVRPGEGGWVIPAGDEVALAAVLEEALARRGRLAEMGRAARQGLMARDPDEANRILAGRVMGLPSAAGH